MKKIKKLIVMVLAAFLLFGCGANIKQSDNKIYTDISTDEAYNFSKAALVSKGYKIQESDRTLGYIIATPENNETFKIENAEKTEVNIKIREDKDQSIVEVTAFADGKIDQELSNKITKEALAEIMAELNKYQKYEIVKDSEYTYPVATRENVQYYLVDYFEKHSSYQIIKNDKNEGSLFVQENQPNSPFNEPLRSKIFILTDESNRVDVEIKSQLKGNYDIKRNKEYVDSFNRDLVSVLSNYPIIEKGLRYTYKFLTFDKAFRNAKASIVEKGYVLGDVDDQNYIITAAKDQVKLTTTFTDINNTLAVNIETFTEGDQGSEKTVLNQNLTDELNGLRNNLMAYQTVVTSTKMFSSMSASNALGNLQKILKKLGYSAKADRDEMIVQGQRLSNSNYEHFVLVNNIGTEGISIELNTLYNNKSSRALALAKQEHSRFLTILGSYDKADLK